MKTTKTPTSKAANAYELLSEVRALILAEPRRYNQYRFISRGKSSRPSAHAPQGYPRCGTVGCVAGWVATLKHPHKFSYGQAEGIATDLLGLTVWTAARLFSPLAVPGDEQTAEHAEAGAKHIAEFQEKNRAQLLAKKV